MKLENTNRLAIEELDQAAGGSCFEMSRDSKFLNALNGSIKRMSSWDCWQLFSDETALTLMRAWKTLGFRVMAYNDTDVKNRYYYKGHELTQDEAYKKAMEITGHYMTENEWK